LGLGFDFLLLVAVALDFLSVFFFQLFDLLGVLQREDRCLIEEKLLRVPPDVLCLIVGPLVGGFRLMQQFLRVCAVAKQ